MKPETISFNLQAVLSISKVFPDGKQELLFKDKNLIVTSGKAILLDQLHYETGTGDPLSFAKVGTGGSFDSEGVFLKVPSEEMTDLYNPVATAAIVRTGSDLAVPSITLTASLDSSVGNNNVINEAGFFSRSGRMFNIKVFPGILKTSSFSLNFEWVIKLL